MDFGSGLQYRSVELQSNQETVISITVTLECQWFLLPGRLVVYLVGSTAGWIINCCSPQHPA